MAVGILSEGRDLRLTAQLHDVGRRPDGQEQRVDAGAAVVGVQVAAGDRRHRRVARDEAAADRAVRRVVGVLQDRRHVRHAAVATRKGMRALPAVPAEIGTRRLARRQLVDLLPAVLADLADHQIAREAVEREAPRVADAVGVDLGSGAGGKRLARRDRVGLSARGARIDAQDLAEQDAGVLSIGAHTAVAHADVEVAVGAELQLAAVVVGGRVRDTEHEAVTGVGNVGAGGGVELPDDDRPVREGRVRVQETRDGVVGGEGDREQAALSAESDLARDVEERCRQDGAALHDAHRPTALDHEHARRIARGEVT